MRSIFERCIAIAMMAAIAVAWQSPPVQAANTNAQEKADEAHDEAAAAAQSFYDARDAVDDAKGRPGRR